MAFITQKNELPKIKTLTEEKDVISLRSKKLSMKGSIKQEKVAGNDCKYGSNIM